MKVYITVKSISSRKNYLDRIEVVLPEKVGSLQALVEELVRRNVESYHASIEEDRLSRFLATNEMEESLATGKVGFDHAHHDQKADLGKALHEAKLAFKDGLYRVFLNGTEVTEYEEAIELKMMDELVFIRLTMLAGRMW